MVDILCLEIQHILPATRAPAWLKVERDEILEELMVYVRQNWNNQAAGTTPGGRFGRQGYRIFAVRRAGKCAAQTFSGMDNNRIPEYWQRKNDKRAGQLAICQLVLLWVNSLWEYLDWILVPRRPGWRSWSAGLTAQDLNNHPGGWEQTAAYLRGLKNWFGNIRLKR